MASEDVIELGSSDDEAEPAIKKIKPTPNAMVHIPRKFHDVTIKPAKLNFPPGIPKELAGKNVTVTKISKGINVLANPYAIKNKPNGKQLQIPIIPKQIQLKPVSHKQMSTFTNIPKKPMSVPTKSVNPLSIMKNINSQVVINKVPSTSKVLPKNPIKVQSPQTINKLPSSITVTRTAGGQKRVAPINIANTARKKQKRNIPNTVVGEVLTVDLDDDEVSSSSMASPQWYLRPEEQTTPTTIEEENNKEPEPAKPVNMVEITIEDSPVKPIKDKRAFEVGTELTVTIDDSPVKTTLEKNAASGSDSEAKKEDKVPHSKKKLEYPKEAEVGNVVEIEISPISVNEPLEEEKVAEPEPSNETDNIIEIEESPLKVQGQGTSTPKKNHPKPPLAVPESIKELQEVEVVNELSEFHPVYQSFIKLCFQLENSDDMKKIVEKKIKTYYRQVPKEYTESEEFIEMVSGKVLSMKAGPEKMYLYIKDIVDELNLQRKMAKSQVLSNINEKKEAEKYYYGADSEHDSKRQRQIRKLEKTLKKLHRAIQKLEDQEVDFDDEEDSVYLLTERYKERMVRVHAKFCQLTNTKMPSEPRVQIDARPGQATGPAKRLEKWVNKKVPIGTPLPFPDFHDVLRCVREANEEDKLGWNEADIMEEARDLFTRCGKKLQRRRQENEWRIAASRISVEGDPAEKNNDLMKKLDENKKVAAKKETEVFNKFADRQSQLKLEAEEIGDKEAEESPVEDDDEELEQSNEQSLENKEKRKERLKRLLQEKSKKTTVDIEIKPDAEVVSETDENLGNKENKEIESGIGTDSTNVETTEKQATMPEKSPSKTDADMNKMEVELNKKDNLELSENKDISESESVKTIDSDTVEFIAKEKDNNEHSKQTNDFKTEEHISTETKKITDNVEKAHSISDDSSKLESDVDELHLLQKLHSENEMNTSTLDSSDSESPVAISDTLGSSSDSKKRASSDIISIENSSYSESETNKDVPESKNTSAMATKIVEEVVDANTELECSSIGIEKKQVRTNNDEYNESIEDILLASTDDEVEIEKSLKPVNDDECVNLKDDALSIGDTVVEGVDKSQAVNIEACSAGNQDDASSLDSVTCVSLKEGSPSESMEVDNQDSECTDTNTANPIQNDNKANADKDTVDLIEDTNSTESENSVPSVNMIEVKESSSEKETELNEDCNTLNGEDKKNSAEKVKETSVIDISKEKPNEVSAESSSLGIESKESQEEIIDAIDSSMKSPSKPSTDHITEPPTDKL